ncbi:MAG: T9SS type A sorting domain-containing protein [Bacteroidetes bacterium]|nr:T9SS type A sorting domain-containing protein [Bacteroidota bacterium]
MKKLLLTLSVVVAAATISIGQSQSYWLTTTFGGSPGGGTISKMSPTGVGFAHVYDFLYATGCNPYGNMIQASDGYLYGTSENGGPSGSCVIFRYDLVNNIYADVHDFYFADGYIPWSGLTELNGVLYGVTWDGGVYSNGVLYSYNLSNGVYTDLYDFNSTYGSYPWSALTVANGKLYGMAMSGGANNQGGLFCYDPATSNYSLLYSLNSSVGDGTTPYGSLLHAADGKFYGLTMTGGTNTVGTIFSFDESTSAFSTLYNLTTASGCQPKAALVQAPNGMMYGTTSEGGLDSNGVVFSFDPANNTYTDIHDLTLADGKNPNGDLTLSAAGLLFGTATGGGFSGAGTAFSFDLSNGAFNVIFNFVGNWGMNPNGGFNFVDMSLGIKDHSPLDASVSLFPNPAQDAITISASNAGSVSFTMINSLGQSVMSWKENSVMNYNKRIDVSALDAGIYFLEMKSGDKVVTKKFVKE